MESVQRHLFMNNLFVYSLLLLMCLCTSSPGIHMENSGIDLLTESYETAPSSDHSITTKRKYLWFGPRLGRRKRIVDNENLSVDEYPSKEFMAEAIRLSSLRGLLPLKARNRNTLNFTPRLGRANEAGPTYMHYPQAAARFSRNHNFIQFSPRLGRKLPLEQKSWFSRRLITDS